MSSLRQAAKKKHIVTERQIIIQLLYHFEGLQQNDIAFLLHLSQASVSRSMKNFRIRHNAALKDDNFEKKYLEYRTKYEAICKRAQQDSNMQI